jgi:hypothetical protein
LAGAVAVVFAVVLADVAVAPIADAREAVTYRAPVPGPVTDPFRPPSSRYGAGNRGIDYRTQTGEHVRAAAAGEVVFAGAVGNSLHVVVLHADGIRTSYSFLRTVSVARGNRVAQGTPIGTANGSLHFGARAGDAYIDPAVLLAGGLAVHLIPDGTVAAATPPARAASESAERAGLVRMVWGGATAAGGALAGGAARLASASVEPATHVPSIAEVQQAVSNLGDLRLGGGHRPALPGEAQIRSAIDTARRIVLGRECTPADVPPPPPAGERHIAVLVGGLGSASGHAAVLDVNTAALGYRAEDVMQFSYRGGAVADNPYTPVDTLQDIRQSGRRLRELLERLQYEHPGVPVDLIAHSQGGLVARSALGDELDPFDPRTPTVGTLVTLATPHHGADLATAAAFLRHTTYGPQVRNAAGALGHKHGLDPRAKSIRQLAETSDFIKQLNRRPLPKGLRAVSIAARRDVVVPTPRSRLKGADNVVVALPGTGNDHSRLPGSPAAQREIALALAGRPPTCESVTDIAADTASGEAIDKAERAATVGAMLATERPPQ